MVKKVGSVKETGRQDKGNCFQQEKRMFVLYMMVTDGEFQMILVSSLAQARITRPRA
jgi:hypothetical protein